MLPDRVMVARLRDARRAGVSKAEARHVLTRAAADQAEKDGWGALALQLTLEDVNAALEAAYWGRQSRPRKGAGV